MVSPPRCAHHRGRCRKGHLRQTRPQFAEAVAKLSHHARPQCAQSAAAQAVAVMLVAVMVAETRSEAVAMGPMVVQVEVQVVVMRHHHGTVAPEVCQRW